MEIKCDRPHVNLCEVFHTLQDLQVTHCILFPNGKKIVFQSLINIEALEGLYYQCQAYIIWMEVHFFVCIGKEKDLFHRKS